MKVYIKNLSDNDIIDISYGKVELIDTKEYQVIVITEGEKASNSHVCIGDVEYTLETAFLNNEKCLMTEKGNFFDNALFLNYFGECTISIQVGDQVKYFYVDINVNGHKAEIAKEMIEYLSEISEDVLLTCFSKTRKSFGKGAGKNKKLNKVDYIEKALYFLDENKKSFAVKKKSKLGRNSFEDGFKIDENASLFILDNIDSVESTSKNFSDFMIGNKYYRLNDRRSNANLETDTFENRVIYTFFINAIKYLSKKVRELKDYLCKSSKDFEYREYIKFDQVVKSFTKPIIERSIKRIEGLLNLSKSLFQFYVSIIPTKHGRYEMPKVSQYVLRNKHYLKSFEIFIDFYKSNDINKNGDGVILGLRNLSQIFEICSLYKIVQSLTDEYKLVSSSWRKDSHSWSGEAIDELNVLCNEFIFKDSKSKITLLYEKKFYRFNKSNFKNQVNNLVRIDGKGLTYEPDFILKVENLDDGEFYFLILDSKFSNISRMKVSHVEGRQGKIQNIYEKYYNGLKYFDGINLVDKTRYVGVLYGLSKSQEQQKRVTLFDEGLDIDSDFPIIPYAAADYISFSKDKNDIDLIIKKYIK